MISNSWMTPEYIVEPSRKVLGPIDLDPASCGIANQVVKANHFFDEAVDGLSMKWFGNVFLNPPGGKVNGAAKQHIWWNKLVEEWINGYVKKAVYVGFSMSILRTGQKSVRGPLRTGSVLMSLYMTSKMGFFGVLDEGRLSRLDMTM